jgi:hypothetical protein
MVRLRTWRAACVSLALMANGPPNVIEDEVILTLGDILTPDVVGDAEVVLAEGSDMFTVDGTPMFARRVTPPNDLDAALIAYLLDLEPPKDD